MKGPKSVCDVRFKSDFLVCHLNLLFHNVIRCPLTLAGLQKKE